MKKRTKSTTPRRLPAKKSRVQLVQEEAEKLDLAMDTPDNATKVQAWDPARGPEEDEPQTQKMVKDRSDEDAPVRQSLAAYWLRRLQEMDRS